MHGCVSLKRSRVRRVTAAPHRVTEFCIKCATMSAFTKKESTCVLLALAAGAVHGESHCRSEHVNVHVRAQVHVFVHVHSRVHEQVHMCSCMRRSRSRSRIKQKSEAEAVRSPQNRQGDSLKMLPQGCLNIIFQESGPLL